jgi:vacuolar fusion protein MON1
MIAADPGILLGALEVSKLRKTTREKINSALLNARHEDLLYGMIVAEGRLVSVIRPRRHSLHPPGAPVSRLCPLAFPSPSISSFLCWILM